MSTATDLAMRVLPVLVFLVALTILAELSDEVGVFAWSARLLTRISRGRTWALVGLVVLLALTVTALLSLDTTAVLLTPAVVVVAEHAALPARPLALLVLWLANTGSLLLPVSNLTNLLAWQQRPASEDTWAFVGLSWAPATAAAVATVVVFAVLYARTLPRRHRAVAPSPPPDRVGFVAALVACAALAPLVLAGVPAWLAASVLAVPLLVLVAWRRRHVLRRPLVPWRALAVVTVMLAVLAVVAQTGPGRAAAAAATHDGTWGGLVSTAAVGAVAANGVNNLPAFLALESGAAGSPTSTMALLVGVNCGPLVTVWGSLATVLWLERVRRRGMVVRPAGLAWQGAVVAAVSVVAASTALWLSG